jgi:hypothetical protein
LCNIVLLGNTKISLDSKGEYWSPSFPFLWVPFYLFATKLQSIFCIYNNNKILLPICCILYLNRIGTRLQQEQDTWIVAFNKENLLIFSKKAGLIEKNKEKYWEQTMELRVDIRTWANIETTNQVTITIAYSSSINKRLAQLYLDMPISCLILGAIGWEERHLTILIQSDLKPTQGI